jgi:hypothetical protein
MPEQALLYGEVQEDEDADVRRILRHPEVKAAFAAIADGMDWAHPDDKAFIQASLDALAARSRAITLAGGPGKDD